jgi:2-polyprenyl-3-methyl-5-hydroxy-6-metoxy-1,4-benzoquinol methylase
MNPILESWYANAQNWIDTVSNSEIESRNLATNEAIVAAILAHEPKSVLDMGCGEGWLCRTLSEKGIQTVGTDAVPQLIKYAIEKGGASYYVADYQALQNGFIIQEAPFDLISINFALLDHHDTEAAIAALPQYLASNGKALIQTLHPFSGIEDGYASGWRTGSWNGLKREFVKPYAWYFRTLSDWTSLFAQHGFKISQIKEPLHPQTQKPLSIIFELEKID